MKNLEEIRSELAKNAEYLQYLNTPLWKEFSNIANSANPKPAADIEYVVVLSSNTTQLRRVALSTANTNLNADFERVRLSIQLARDITSLRTSKPSDALTIEEIKTHGPFIVYVGTELQNADLIISLQGDNDKIGNVGSKGNESNVPLHNDYPINKFMILTLEPSNISSKGQFLTIANKLNLSKKTIAWITHAYHLPRISRQIGKMINDGVLPSNFTQYAFLVDRDFQLKGSLENVVGELKRIAEYTKKGDLALQPYSVLIAE